eukprot:SAG31_NODE_137_length_23063_cov_5.002569_2_plen_290_part_00
MQPDRIRMIMPVKESLDHILVRRQRRLHALVRVLSPGVRFGLRLPLEKPRRDVPLKVDFLAAVACERQLVLRVEKRLLLEVLSVSTKKRSPHLEVLEHLGWIVGLRRRLKIGAKPRVGVEVDDAQPGGRGDGGGVHACLAKRRRATRAARRAQPAGGAPDTVQQPQPLRCHAQVGVAFGRRVGLDPVARARPWAKALRVGHVGAVVKPQVHIVVAARHVDEGGGEALLQDARGLADVPHLIRNISAEQDEVGRRIEGGHLRGEALVQAALEDRVRAVVAEGLVRDRLGP